MSDYSPIPNWDWLLAWLIACYLLTFSSFSLLFANSNALCPLKYSSYKTKTEHYIVPSLLPRDTRETESDVDNLQIVCVCLCGSDRQTKKNKVRRTTSKNTAAQHFSTAPGQQAIFQKGTEIEYQGWMYSWRYLQVLKLLTLLLPSILETLVTQLLFGISIFFFFLKFVQGTVSEPKALAEHPLVHNYPYRAGHRTHFIYNTCANTDKFTRLPACVVPRSHIPTWNLCHTGPQCNGVILVWWHLLPALQCSYLSCSTALTLRGLNSELLILKGPVCRI